MKARLNQAHSAIRLLANGVIRRFLSLASEVVILTTWLNTAFASAPPTPAPGWSTTTSLPNGYYQQVFVYWNGFFYQAGGYISDNDNPSSDVLYAQVQTNMNMVAWTTNSTYGGLSYSISNNLVGTWNETTPLPDVVAFPAGVAVDGFLYVLSGCINSYGPYPNNTVYYAPINSNGSVGVWQTTTPLPSPEWGLGSASWKGRIYTTGGCNGLYFTNAVWSAQIQTNGSLLSWVAQTPLPEAVIDHACVVVNGFLYVLGGSLWEGGSTNNVYYSKINADGSLAAWNQTTSMPQALENFSAVVADGQIFTLDGLTYSSGLASGFYSAPLAGDGSLGPWTEPANFSQHLIPPPYVLFSYGMAVADNYLFVAGGTTTDEGGDSTVYSFALPPPPTVPTLALQNFATNGTLQLRLTSTTNTGFGLSVSLDLINWTNIGWGFTDTNGNLTLKDTNACAFPSRFYRAYWPLP